MSIRTQGATKPSNGDGYKKVSLEKRLTLNLASEDDVLKDGLARALQSNYNLHSSTLFDIIEEPVNKTSDIYLVDLLLLPATDYNKAIEKIKYIKAIRPESKVVVLATATQQANEDFALFKEAKGRSLIEIYPRVDPSQLTESDYIKQLTDLSTKLPPFLDEIYKKNGKLEHVKVVKIGGSIFDLYNRKPRALPNLLKAIVEAQHNHPIVLTVGGGPLHGLAESYKKRLRVSNEAYEKLSEAQLTYQAKTVADLLEKIEPEIALPIPMESLEFILTNNLFKELIGNRIPIVSLLPGIDTEKLKIPRIPSYNSDVHTVYFADILGVRKIIFAKDTDGVYLRDPNLPDNLVNKLREQFRGENICFDYIFAGDIQKRIERKGLNPRGEVTDEHLIETLALGPFIQSRVLYTIQIVNGTKPQQLVDAMNGVKAGSYIIK